MLCKRAGRRMAAASLISVCMVFQMFPVAAFAEGMEGMERGPLWEQGVTDMDHVADTLDETEDVNVTETDIYDETDLPDETEAETDISQELGTPDNGVESEETEITDGTGVLNENNNIQGGYRRPNR